MIIKFNLFLEAKFSDISINDIDFDTIYHKDKFIDDDKLLDKIHINKYDKEIYLKWYDTEIHSIKDRINTRTPINSIKEFNEILNKKLILLFEKHLKEIAVKMSDSKLNRIAVRIPDFLSYIIIDYNVNSLYDDITFINIISIIPKIISKSRINRIFYL